MPRHRLDFACSLHRMRESLAACHPGMRYAEEDEFALTPDEHGVEDPPEPEPEPVAPAYDPYQPDDDTFTPPGGAEEAPQIHVEGDAAPHGQSGDVQGMGEDDAFLAAIRANPDDDTTRLVYADFLDESGRPEEGNQLRLVTRLGREAREGATAHLDDGGPDEGEGEVRRTFAMMRRQPVALQRSYVANTLRVSLAAFGADVEAMPLVDQSLRVLEQASWHPQTAAALIHQRNEVNQAAWQMRDEATQGGDPPFFEYMVLNALHSVLRPDAPLIGNAYEELAEGFLEAASYSELASLFRSMAQPYLTHMKSWYSRYAEEDETTPAAVPEFEPAPPPAPTAPPPRMPFNPHQQVIPPEPPQRPRIHTTQPVTPEPPPSPAPTTQPTHRDAARARLRQLATEGLGGEANHSLAEILQLEAVVGEKEAERIRNEVYNEVIRGGKRPKRKKGYARYEMDCGTMMERMAACRPGMRYAEEDEYPLNPDEHGVGEDPPEPEPEPVAPASDPHMPDDDTFAPPGGAEEATPQIHVEGQQPAPEFQEEQSAPGAGSEDASFVRALAANPDDDTTRLVLADYLDESGRTDAGSTVRWGVDRRNAVRRADAAGELTDGGYDGQVITEASYGFAQRSPLWVQQLAMVEFVRESLKQFPSRMRGPIQAAGVDRILATQEAVAYGLADFADVATGIENMEAAGDPVLSLMGDALASLSTLGVYHDSNAIAARLRQVLWPMASAVGRSRGWEGEQRENVYSIFVNLLPLYDADQAPPPEHYSRYAEEDEFPLDPAEHGAGDDPASEPEPSRDAPEPPEAADSDDQYEPGPAAPAPHVQHTELSEYYPNTAVLADAWIGEDQGDYGPIGERFRAEPYNQASMRDPQLRALLAGAVHGDDTPLHALADYLDDMGHPGAEEYRRLLGAGDAHTAAGLAMDMVMGRYVPPLVREAVRYFDEVDLNPVKVAYGMTQVAEFRAHLPGDARDEAGHQDLRVYEYPDGGGFAAFLNTRRGTAMGFTHPTPEAAAADAIRRGERQDMLTRPLRVIPHGQEPYDFDAPPPPVLEHNSRYDDDGSPGTDATDGGAAVTGDVIDHPPSETNQPERDYWRNRSAYSVSPTQDPPYTSWGIQVEGSGLEPQYEAVVDEGRNDGAITHGPLDRDRLSFMCGHLSQELHHHDDTAADMMIASARRMARMLEAAAPPVTYADEETPVGTPDDAPDPPMPEFGQRINQPRQDYARTRKWRAGGGKYQNWRPGGGQWVEYDEESTPQAPETPPAPPPRHDPPPSPPEPAGTPAAPVGRPGRIPNLVPDLPDDAYQPRPHVEGVPVERWRPEPENTFQPPAEGDTDFPAPWDEAGNVGAEDEVGGPSTGEMAHTVVSWLENATMGQQEEFYAATGLDSVEQLRDDPSLVLAFDWVSQHEHPREAQPLTPPPMDGEVPAFLSAMAADPQDDTTRLVFADYLEENGFEPQSQRLRWGVEARDAAREAAASGAGRRWISTDTLVSELEERPAWVQRLYLVDASRAVLNAFPIEESEPYWTPRINRGLSAAEQYAQGLLTDQQMQMEWNRIGDARMEVQQLYNNGYQDMGVVPMYRTMRAIAALDNMMIPAGADTPDAVSRIEQIANASLGGGGIGGEYAARARSLMALVSTPYVTHPPLEGDEHRYSRAGGWGVQYAEEDEYPLNPEEHGTPEPEPPPDFSDPPEFAPHPDDQYEPGAPASPPAAPHIEGDFDPDAEAREREDALMGWPGVEPGQEPSLQNLEPRPPTPGQSDPNVRGFMQSWQQSGGDMTPINALADYLSEDGPEQFRRDGARLREMLSRGDAGAAVVEARRLTGPHEDVWGGDDPEEVGVFNRTDRIRHWARDIGMNVFPAGDRTFIVGIRGQPYSGYDSANYVLTELQESGWEQTGGNWQGWQMWQNPDGRLLRVYIPDNFDGANGGDSVFIRAAQGPGGDVPPYRGFEQPHRQ